MKRAPAAASGAVFGAVSVILAATIAAPVAEALEPTKLQRKVYERIDRSAKVIEALLDAPDAGLPQGLLNRAECVAVIPGMKKLGLAFGGRYGRGVVSCRRRDGLTDWGAPSMISLKGGSFGLQIGGASIDVVMLIFNQRGLERLLGDNFELGGDVSVAAGPVGRATTAETNIRFNAKILTYSRSKGLFAGLELKGAVIKQDRDANYALYEAEWEPDEVLFTDHVAVPGNARWLIDVLGRRSPTPLEIVDRSDGDESASDDRHDRR